MKFMKRVPRKRTSAKTINSCEREDISHKCPLCSPPLLHSWDGGETWNTGGMNLEDANWLYSISKSEVFRVIESGAGLSTLIFGMNSKTVISMVIERDLIERIYAAIGEFKLVFDWQSHCGFSERILPTLNSYADLCLIDGGHGFPTPYVDFYFMNRLLRKGGLLIVDDIQLPAPRELVLNLIQSKHYYEFVSFSPTNKTIALRKLTDFDQLPDFGGMQRDLSNIWDFDAVRGEVERALKTI